MVNLLTILSTCDIIFINNSKFIDYSIKGKIDYILILLEYILKT